MIRERGNEDSRCIEGNIIRKTLIVFEPAPPTKSLSRFARVRTDSGEKTSFSDPRDVASPDDAARQTSQNPGQ